MSSSLRILIIGLLPAAVAVAATALPVPKIDKATATATALAAVPGGVVKASELEREHGRLIYSYDIAVAGKSGIDEVAIDANTGKLVAKTHETPKMEKVEAAADAKAAARKTR